MNALNKLTGFLRARVKSGFFAAFAPLAFQPLADVSESAKLSALYSSNQNLVAYINSLFKMAIAVGAIIAVIRLLIAGYMYMGGDIWHTKEKAKIIITDVFVGLALLLSIWIILSQINPQLLNLRIAFPRTPVVPGAPAAAPSQKYAVFPTEQTALDKILEDEGRMRELLQRVGIGVNKGRCTAVGQRNCTNVGLLGVTAIGGLQKLKANCRCSPVVSGGTEFWLHSTHGPNKPVVDIAKGNSQLDQYIRANGAIARRDSLGRATYSLDGGSFFDEDAAHWHVTF